MILAAWHILASGDDGIAKLIGLVVVVAIAIISKVLKSRDESTPPPRRQKPAGAPPVPRRKPTPERIATQSVAGTPLQPPVPRQQTDAQRKPVVPPRVHRKPAMPPPPPRQGHPAVRVGEELARQAQRMEAQQEQRDHRMATSAPAEADSAAIAAKLMHVRPKSADGVAAAVGGAVVVDLRSPQAARMAIVYHEIFSPPKALREGGEMWDQ
jgi:hypothetical protein